MEHGELTLVRDTSPMVASPEARFTPGTVVAGRYRIVSLLGGGGMGEVYRADDLKLGQRVALKYVPLRQPNTLERLYAEVRIGRMIAHPNVTRLYDVVEVDGQHFITMEYVDGEDLASLLRRIGRLPADKALALARDLASGLAAAHACGFVHRDLKPANVMIDGRGMARITDFGLAGLAHESASAGGTPLYMAPEQLDAGVATTRSDIYALGLVFFEMFTGRRVFDARTLQDLRAQHAAPKTRPAAVVSEIDPAVERVILRCLEEEPQHRFTTADEVLLALPGGDPLRAAVAAGETPSPEMVAAAARTGELSAPRAWTMLVLTLALLAAVPAMRLRNDVRGYLPEVKSPAVLDDRAATILRRLGYTPPPHTHGAYLRTTPKYGARIGPDAAPYLYRGSPKPLVPLNEAAVVRRNDPALIEPGMTSMLLDAEGKLLELRRVAGADGERKPAAPLLFEAAGLDMREFRPVPPQGMAMVPSDARAAWIRDRDQLRVEAASAAGRPVWFAVLKPGAVPYADERPRDSQAMSVVFLMVMIVGAFFARRNVVRGRADLRGAMRVALFNTVSWFIAGISIARHQLAPADEFVVLTGIAGAALYFGLVGWVSYLAIEPYFRRRWPHLLIGWTRVLGGRFRDPLVGAELLLGVTAGVVAWVLSDVLLFAIGDHELRNALSYPAVQSRLGVFYAPLRVAATAVGYGLGIALILLVCRLVFRRDAPAWIAALAICVAANTTPRLGWIAASTTFMLLMLLAFRFGGLLALVAAFFCAYSVGWPPLTLDPSEWYFFRTLVALLIPAALAVYGFRAAMAGKPLLGPLELEDEAQARR
ncbi:MAG TPA: serine/threonine-protein kinase [Thermoanaerobaculia bacterium]|nr:serine/threonine-protein kinase [Thermoanaerobaculia bacterium]